MEAYCSIVITFVFHYNIFISFKNDGWCLLSMKCIQGPDVSWSSPVSGDDHTLTSMNTTQNVINVCDDWHLGQPHYCILEIHSCFKSLKRIKQNRFIQCKSLFIVKKSVKYWIVIYMCSLTSRTSQLTGELFNKMAEIMFSHQCPLSVEIQT